MKSDTSSASSQKHDFDAGTHNPIPAQPEIHAAHHRLQLDTTGVETEIRRDYLHDYYVLIAPKRADRPYDAALNDHPLLETASSPRLDLQREVSTIVNETNDGWAVKVVENKYPALTLDNANAFGKQEIVIDTPLANTTFGELPASQIEKILHAYRQRYFKLGVLPHIAYVSVFRNDGYEAGASLAHAHSQIYALPFIPPRIQNESDQVEKIALERGHDPYDDIISFEMRENLRIIANNEHWICFAPYAPLWQMEAWVLPKRQSTSFTDLIDDEITSLAPILKLLTSKLNKQNINYNLSIETGVSPHHRLTIKLRGRNVVSPWGGLEVTTGVIINTIPSEAAARWYRDE